jgi:hypothetical protein
LRLFRRGDKVNVWYRTFPRRPARGSGCGRIVRSLVERIGGELRIGRGDMDQGARFTVLFS